jgi:O-antigen ligase
MTGINLFSGVALLTLATPFELTEPLLRLPGQSITTLEAAVLGVFVAWSIAIVGSRRLPQWRTPLTWPWLALLLAMAVASMVSPVSPVNAWHMTGRLGAALGIYLLTVNAVTTPVRLRTALGLALGVGVVVSVLAILEYAGTRPVLVWLRAFRPGVATVGAQIRAGGPLQYPTIASMYLEVVFAFGLGLLLSEHAAPRRRRGRIVAVFIAVVVVGEAITLTFTRAGLITMALSLALAGVLDRRVRGRAAATPLVAGVAIAIAALFLASRSTQSMWLRLTSEGQEAWYRASVTAPAALEMASGHTTLVPVTVVNTGRLAWDSSANPPIFLSYHWRPLVGDGYVIFEGARTAFDDLVAPESDVTVAARVRAPRQPGRYRLEWDLVQEGRLWFSTEPGSGRTLSDATVRGAATLLDDGPMMPPPRPTVRPGRRVLWDAAARMFAAHPLTGVGPDNFRLAYGAYAGIAHADARTHSNNMYLELLAGGGLLVFAAFAWLFWRAAGSVARLVRARDPRSTTLGLGIAAAALAIGVHAAVDSFLSFAPTYVLFSLTLGCVVACGRGMEAPTGAHRV